MKLNWTLSSYIFKHFLRAAFIVATALFILIFMVEFVETIRRGADKDIPLLVTFQITLLKLPIIIEDAIPFIMLISAMLSFMHLNRHQELAVIRSAGVSVWQFMAPSLFAAFCLGTLTITLLNPVSSVLFAKFEQAEAKYLKRKANALSISSSGLWLRQQSNINTDDTGDSSREIIIYAKRANERDINDTIELLNVIAFMFDDEGNFDFRIDAERAKLFTNFWQFKNVISTSSTGTAKRYKEYFLETNLTVLDIQNSFASPGTISFWDLSSFIETLEKSGFSALDHRSQWHRILSSPLTYCSMILVAAVFSLQPIRQGKTGLLITTGIIASFLIYFLTNLISSLGLSGNIPVILAVWAPAVAILLTAIGLLLHLEDG